MRLVIETAIFHLPSTPLTSCAVRMRRPAIVRELAQVICRLVLWGRRPFGPLLCLLADVPGASAWQTLRAAFFARPREVNRLGLDYGGDLARPRALLSPKEPRNERPRAIYVFWPLVPAILWTSRSYPNRFVEPLIQEPGAASGPALSSRSPCVGDWINVGGAKAGL